jgi:hypothetical protein
MRLSKLLLALAVAVGAFALFGANARVAMADGGPVISPSNPFAYPTVHLADDSIFFGFAPLFCPTDPNCQESPQFKSSVAGTLEFTATYTLGPTFMNMVGVYLCQVNTGDVVTNGNCPSGQTEIICNGTDTGAEHTDFASNTATVDRTCAVGANIPYALFFVPYSVDSCTDEDPLMGCTGTRPGIDVTGTISVTGVTIAQAGGNFGKVKGGGDVFSTQDADFAELGFAKSDKFPKGHVEYRDKAQQCKFRSKDITSVSVQPNMTGPGGTAQIDGDGYVITGHNIKTFVNFHVDTSDSGQKTTGDTFQLTTVAPPPATTTPASGQCSTPSSQVTHGDVKITPTDDGHDG